MNIRLISALGASALLAGCGTSIPSMDLGNTSEPNAKAASAAMVNSVATHVHCELRRAIIRTARDLNAPWLSSWSAKVSLTVTADEKTTVNPGVSFATLFPSAVNKFANGTSATTGQSFALGIGASASIDATRVHTLGWFEDFTDFKDEATHLKNIDDKCEKDGTYPIEGDLQIEENIYAAVKAATTLGSVSQPFATGGPLDSVQHHVTFDLAYGANATPTWKFVNVSGSTPGNLYNASRDRKDDLLITMGPSEIADTKRKLAPAKRIVQASQSVVNAHLAAQIGESVATAIHAINP